MLRRVLLAIIGLGIIGGLAGVATVHANERRFAFSNESAVLPPGVKELEYWMTWRDGRKNFYSRFDHRLEYEFGITSRLQSSLYLNWNRVTEDVGTEEYQTTSDFSGISSEWKYKFMDPVADAFGFALYEEITLETDAVAPETKFIFDKKVGTHLFVYNLVLEPEWVFESNKTEKEFTVENTLGYTHFFTPRFSAGLEVFQDQHHTDAGWVHSALFTGPVVSYAKDNWWATLTWLQQLPAIKSSIFDPGENLVLDDHEKVNVRILLSTRI